MEKHRREVVMCGAAHMRDLSAVGMAIIFLVLGVVCLFFPERIQTFTLSYHAEHEIVAKLNPLVNWMKGPNYVVSLRLVGMFAVVGFLVIVLALIKGV